MIGFLPNSTEVKTWAEVFDIRGRYLEDVFKLDKFSGWLMGFIKHTRKYNLLMNPDATDVKSCMRDYLELIEKTDLDNKGFIQFAVFDFLLKKAPDDYFDELGNTILSR